MPTNLQQMIDVANAVVPRITPTQAMEMIDWTTTLVVDVREQQELLETGMIAGAIHVPRGVLELRADPESDSHDSHFSKHKTVILYCSGGRRAALGGKALKELGYAFVYNLRAFTDWIASGGAVQQYAA
jgi:rhodanese-related sulfurtransferase